MKNTLVEQTNTYPVLEKKIQIQGHTFRLLEQGEGPVILFSHGFPDIAESWLKQMDILSKAGYRAIAMDMRGFGDSYAPEDHKLYSAKHIVADYVGVLDALHIHHAVIVGHDWGADHAQKAVLMHPDRFKALVTISIPFMPRGDKSYFHTLRQNGYADTYYSFDMINNQDESTYQPASDVLRSVYYWLSGSPDPDTGWDPIDTHKSMFRPSPVEIPHWLDPNYLEKSIEAFTKNGFQRAINHYRATETTFEETAELKGMPITQPSLYIWGKSDGLCQFFHPEVPSLTELQLHFPGLRKQVALDHVGHWPHQEAPELVAHEITSFLRQLDTL